MKIPAKIIHPLRYIDPRINSTLDKILERLYIYTNYLENECNLLLVQEYKNYIITPIKKETYQYNEIRTSSPQSITYEDESWTCPNYTYELDVTTTTEYIVTRKENSI